MEIKIKYLNDKIKHIKKIPQGDWIDLRAAEKVTLKAGEFKLIPLGVAMELPGGYEAHIAPRSSTFKNFGVIQTNSIGVIDSNFCGDSDWWLMPVLATRDVTIHLNDRLCQFRIVPKMRAVDFREVDTLDNADRGGFGSTGVE